MGRLVIVSNRVAQPRGGARAGGLEVALRDALTQRGGMWFGWSGEISSDIDEAPKMVRAGRVQYATLNLSPDEHDGFYTGFSNSTLWPLFHYRIGLIDFHRSAFRAYRQVNARFAAALAPLLRPDDVVWVHDYHFMPLAAELRALGLRNRIGFFLHIPFPAKEVLAALPAHEQLVEALCSYDLIGFQTAGDLGAFARFITDEATGTFDPESGRMRAYGRETRAAAYPIGIDTEAFAALAEGEAGSEETGRLHSSLAGRSLIMGVDRLDHSKGLPHRFEAFHELLGSYPDNRGKVTFLQVAPISRGEVAQYRALRRQLEALAGRINGKYAEFDWVPIRYLNRPLPRQTLAGFYRTARVGLVTPLRDGMNLVAKEYVAAQDPADPGVLILSRFAGAACELPQALIVNPFDVDQVAAALNRALNMPQAERIARWEAMMDSLRGNTVGVWCENFLRDLGRGELVSPEEAA